MLQYALLFLAMMALVSAVATTQDNPTLKDAPGGDSMLYSVETQKSLAKLREDVPKACQVHKFGVMSVIDLKEKMKEKGVEYGGECLIFEVCNPQKAKQTLEVNPEISAALPCRISAFRTKEGNIRLSTLRPSKLVELFASVELKQLADEVEETIKGIMNEAARSESR